jgi:hypothetical protein
VPVLLLCGISRQETGSFFAMSSSIEQLLRIRQAVAEGPYSVLLSTGQRCLYKVSCSPQQHSHCQVNSSAASACPDAMFMTCAARGTVTPGSHTRTCTFLVFPPILQLWCDTESAPEAAELSKALGYTVVSCTAALQA